MSEQPTVTAGGPPPAPGPDSGPLPRGSAVGRYLILEPIGQGGMGQVYAAVDPELGRKIAIKLVSAGPSGSQSGSDGQIRLLREAQAMARVSHPNVVTVYDVGTFGGGVFVAMELVEGRTLTLWLKEQAWPRREILRRFTDAGVGLAAAHAAGLVHRDFKPDNVLVDRAERARVTDFGLARPPKQSTEPEAVAPAAVAPAPEAIGRLLSAELTHANAVPGTRAFMAPEQFAGGPVDARTDQFAFCVALYRALYGVAPFAGDGVKLEMAVAQGKVQPAPSDAAVAPWLRRILLKGLSVEPSQRFASMEALLAELAKDPVAQRRRWALGMLGAGVLVAGFAGAWRLAGREQRVCQGASGQLAGVWDDARRAAVEHAFQASPRPYARDAASAVRRELDARALAWTAARVDACEATRVRQEQSEHVMDLRMACLDDRLREMKELVSLFAVAEDDVVRKAVQAASGLTNVRVCADLTALGQGLAPVKDAAQRADVDAVRAQLASPRALSLAARYPQALAAATPLVERARAVGYLPLLAEVLVLQGELQRDAGDAVKAERTLLEALWTAEESKHDEAAARAAIALTDVVGVRQGRREPGQDWARLAEALARRTAASDETLGALWNIEGNLNDSQGKYAEALGFYQRSLQARRAAFGDGHFQVGLVYNNLGQTLSELGRFDEAQAALENAVETERRAFGAEHPALGAPLTNLGTLEMRRGRFEQALAHHRAALELDQKSLGMDHPSAAVALGNLADTYLAMKRWPEAVQSAQAGLAIFEKRFGPAFADSAYLLTTLGRAELGAGRRKEAVEALEKSLARVKANPLPPELGAATRFALAQALWEVPADRKRAHALATEALEAVAHDTAPDSPREEIARWLAEHPG